MAFDDFILSEMEMIAHRGAENASASLTALLNHHTTVTVNGVEIVHIEQIPTMVNGSDSHCVGIVSRICGDIEGNSVLMFEQNDAVHIANTLGSKVDEVREFGKLEQSMLSETANIMISSFMNSMTFHLALHCQPKPPIYLQDLAGAILSSLLLEAAMTSDLAILFSTKFVCRDENINGMFIFLPSPESLNVIVDGISSDD